MILSEKLLDELISLQDAIYKVTSCNGMTEIQLENFLKEFERRRYKILEEIKKYNATVQYTEDKINFIDNDYKAELIDNTLKMYIPETMPKYKNIKTHTYKRILLNVAEITKQYKGMFKDGAFIYIKVFDNQSSWDIDNKFIKPIPDGLILSEVISDDNIEKMFYSVKGEFDEIPHTEVYISTCENMIEFLEKNKIT